MKLAAQVYMSDRVIEVPLPTFERLAEWAGMIGVELVREVSDEMPTIDIAFQANGDDEPDWRLDAGWFAVGFDPVIENMEARWETRKSSGEQGWSGWPNPPYSTDETELIQAEFLLFLANVLSESTPSSGTGDDDQVRLLVEVVHTLWITAEPALRLTPDEKRVADALLLMASETAKCEEPPRAALSAAARWLLSKANRFTDKFIDSAADASGKAVAIGAGAALSGHLPTLIAQLQRLITTLGGT